jgi:hypothetical protein
VRDESEGDRVTGTAEWRLCCAVPGPTRVESIVQAYFRVDRRGRCVSFGSGGRVVMASRLKAHTLDVESVGQ